MDEAEEEEGDISDVEDIECDATMADTDVSKQLKTVKLNQIKQLYLNTEQVRTFQPLFIHIFVFTSKLKKSVHFS